jgi:hypothetical protein
MSTAVLGSLSFDSTPDVSGSNTIITDGTVPTFTAGITGSRPTAGQTGRIYVDTTSLGLFRDNGSTWDSLSGLISLTQVTNQTAITQATGSTPAIIGLSNDVVLPGTGGFVPPVGTTAQRPTTPAAGTTRWNSTLGYSEQYNGTVWQPRGRLIQAASLTVSGTTGTTTFTIGTTVPTTALMTAVVATATFTPISASSTLIVRWGGIVAVGTAGRSVLVSLFSGTTHQVSGAALCASTNSAYPVSIHATWVPGSTAAITITLRAAITGAAANWYVNNAGSNTLGGGFASEMTIEEYL